MMTCLIYLIPISCVLMMGVSLWVLTIPSVVQDLCRFILLGLCLVGTFVVIKQLVSTYSAPPGTGMPGMWSTMGVPGYQGAKR
jgi:hypothetical protein